MAHVSTESLHQAIQKGDEAHVKRLVNDGANMDEVLGLRGTALCAAISAKQISIAEFLIVAGCDVNAEDYDREPPLLLSLRKELLSVAEQIIYHPRCNLNKIDPLTKIPPLCYASKVGLHTAATWLMHAGCNLSQQDADGNSPLHLAVSNKQYLIIEQLINQDASLILCNDQGCNPVHVAAQTGDVTALKLMFSKWIKIDPTWEKSNECNVKFKIIKAYEDKVFSILNLKTKLRNDTALTLAIREGHDSVAKLLLKFGTDPNVDGKSDISPLLLACSYVLQDVINMETIQCLLSAGARTDCSSARILYGTMEIPIVFAAKRNALELVKTLVAYGSDINYFTILEGCKISPLYQSLLCQSLQVSWYFLRNCKSNLKLTETDIFGRNYLHAIVNIKAHEVDDFVHLLVAGGCAVDGSETQRLSETPLHSAARENNFHLVSSLIKHGACVNMVLSDSGYTPLHICADEGNLQITRLLLESGSRINMKDVSGKTPLEIALDYIEDDYIELCKFLLRAGSDIPNDIKINEINEQSDNDDSDESDSLVNGEMPAAMEEDENLKRCIFERLRMPRSLQEFSIFAIRNHFISNAISFKNISKLPVPKRFVDKLLYRDC